MTTLLVQTHVRDIIISDVWPVPVDEKYTKYVKNYKILVIQEINLSSNGHNKLQLMHCGNSRSINRAWVWLRSIFRITRVWIVNRYTEINVIIIVIIIISSSISSSINDDTF